MTNKKSHAKNAVKKTMKKRSSPHVKTKASNITETKTPKGGLRQSQAAVAFVKDMMRRKDYDTSSHEASVIQQLDDDTQNIAGTGADIGRAIVKRNMRKKARRISDEKNKQAADKQSADGQAAADKPQAGTGGEKKEMPPKQPEPARQKPQFSNSVSVSSEKQKAMARERFASRSKRSMAASQSRAKSAARAAQARTQKAVVLGKAKGKAVAAKNTAQAVKTGTSLIAKIAAAPVAMAALAIVLVILLVVVVIAVVVSPTGIFFSDSEDNPNPVSGIVQSIGGEWLDGLAAQRKEYEDKGYVVNVYYGIPNHDDSSRLDNWRDVLALYTVANSDGEQAQLVFSDEDVQNIRDLYFEMNPMSVDIWTETVETEVEKEVETKVEKSRNVYNPKTGKFEKEVYYETVTETVTEVETETIEHADIWVRNKRYIEMLDQYPLDDEQLRMIAFLLDYQNAPLWNQLGVTGGVSAGDIVGDISGIIKDLPPGTLGSKIAELAFTRLGDPYSMELRGQGRYIDCSGLSQWCYAQVGIALPDTAAEQARWCVDNGKVIDPSAAVPGDLVFFKSDSGRVKNSYERIGHVGIYVGNGMMVDASSSKGCVVYRAVYSSPFIYARAHV